MERVRITTCLGYHKDSFLPHQLTIMKTSINHCKYYLWVTLMWPQIKGTEGRIQVAW